MKNVVKFALLALALVLFVSGATATEVQVKNVIIFISDGWGQAQLDATAYYNGARQDYEVDPSWSYYGMTNYMICEGGESPPYGGDGFVGIWGYDPATAWNDWFYMQNYATGSAAAGTAMSCGVKAFKGSIGMGQGDGPGQREPLLHLFEVAEDRGLSTGTVTSVQVSHATPATFIAHNESRNNYAEIFQDQFGSDMEVLMGCGHPNYDADGMWDAGDPDVPGDWKYVGGYDTYMALANGESPWTYIDEKTDFEGLASGDWIADRVCGIPQVSHTLQFNRSGDSQPYTGNFNTELPPYHDPMVSNVPSLETMTEGALNVLSQNPEGFALVVEGGAIDWGGHARLMGRSIEEQDDYNAAVAAAVAWVEANSNWEESLVVVTGDHECGYLWGPGVDPENPDTWFAPLVDNGAGNVPGFYYYSAPYNNDDWQNPANAAGHTNQAIPFYAKGVGAELWTDYVDGTDPNWGDYIDNTDVANLIFQLYGGALAIEDEPEVAADTPEAVVLHQNWPNPFNPLTNIKFDLPRTTVVDVRVIDVNGRVVKMVSNDRFEAGTHSVMWDGTDQTGKRCASGTYFYQIATDFEVATGKMTLVK